MLPDEFDECKQYSNDQRENKYPIKYDGSSQKHIFERTRKPTPIGDDISTICEAIEESNQGQKTKNDYQPSKEKGLGNI